MGTTYVVIEDTVYTLDTVEECEAASVALREAEGPDASTPVYVGEPDGLGDSYRNGQILCAAR